VKSWRLTDRLRRRSRRMSSASSPSFRYRPRFRPNALARMICRRGRDAACSVTRITRSRVKQPSDSQGPDAGSASPGRRWHSRRWVSGHDLGAREPIRRERGLPCDIIYSSGTNRRAEGHRPRAITPRRYRAESRRSGSRPTLLAPNVSLDSNFGVASFITRCWGGRSADAKFRGAAVVEPLMNREPIDHAWFAPERLVARGSPGFAQRQATGVLEAGRGPRRSARPTRAHIVATCRERCSISTDRPRPDAVV